MHRVFYLYGSYHLLKDERVFQHAIKPEDDDGSPTSLVLEGLYLTHEASIPRASGFYMPNEVRVLFPKNWVHPTREILDDFLDSKYSEIIVSGVLSVYVDKQGRLQTVLRANPATPVSR